MSAEPNRKIYVIIILIIAVVSLFYVTLNTPLKPPQENIIKSMGIDVKDDYCMPDDPLYWYFGAGISSGGKYSQPLWDKFWTLQSLGVRIMGVRESSDGKVYVGFREVTLYEVLVLRLMVSEIPATNLIIRRTTVYVPI